MPVLRPFRFLLLLPVMALVVGCDYSVNSEVGPPGPPGRDGDNADIQVFTATFDGSDLFVDEGSQSARAIFPVDELTEDIVEFGVVLAYVDGAFLRDDDAGVTWVALPMTTGENDDDGDNEVDFTITYSYSYEVERFTVELFASSPLEWSEQGALDLKIVLLSAGQRSVLANATTVPTYETLVRDLDLETVSVTPLQARSVVQDALD
ncbi:MAG: hypothetical protein AAGF99_06790 [Bacteroidota bacterium]